MSGEPMLTSMPFMHSIIMYSARGLSHCTRMGKRRNTHPPETSTSGKLTGRVQAVTVSFSTCSERR